MPHNAARPDAARAAGLLGAALGIAEGSAISWMTKGACIECPDTDCSPSEGEPGEDAKVVSRVYPVTKTCLAHALSRHEDGVWGGTTERERRVVCSYVASRELGRSGSSTVSSQLASATGAGRRGTQQKVATTIRTT